MRTAIETSFVHALRLRHTKAPRKSDCQSVLPAILQKGMPMNTKTYSTISGLTFGLVSLAHLFRLLNQWTFQLGPFVAPVWFSWVGMFVAGMLSVWGFRLARK
jgi:hypothetical protein